MVATAAALPSGAVLASAKKRAAAKAKKKTTGAKKKAAPRVQKVHPRTAELVDSAIAALGDRGGSSLPDIKKYIAATYNVDAEKLTPLIKKALASKVTGSPGAFKIDAKPAAAATPKKRSTVKKTAKKSPKKKGSGKKKVGRPSLGGKPPKPKAAKKKSAGKKKAGKKAAKK